MTDHAGEQEMELEALQAILMDDLEEYEGMLPPGWTGHGQTYKVQIRPTEELEGGGDDDELGLELLFARERGALRGFEASRPSREQPADGGSGLLA
jgi:hypothetical protein